MRPLFYCILYFYPCSCLFCHFILRFCAILLLFLAVLTLKTLSYAPFLFKLYFLYLSNEMPLLKHSSPLFCTFNHHTIIIHYIIENCNSNISQSEFLQGFFLGHLVNLRGILGGFCNFHLLICHRLVICKLLINFMSYNILWYFKHLHLYKDSRYFRETPIHSHRIDLIKLL